MPQDSRYQGQMNSGMLNPGDPLNNRNFQSNFPNDPRSRIEAQDYEDPTTFVKVRLTDENVQHEVATDCREGLDPEWNESLVINYKSNSANKKFTLNE